MQHAIGASLVFNGDHWLEDHAVILSSGQVVEVLPFQELHPGLAFHFHKDRILFPALIDVQVYGAEARLFSVYRTASTLECMAESFLKKGTLLFQPTIATNTKEVIKECIDAVRQYRKNGGRHVHGLHVEGPWIHPSKKGAHLEQWIHVPSLEEVKDLLDYGEGVITMITLAPEVCSKEIIEYIVKRGVKVSAGHSDAGYEVAMQGFDLGISSVTHLFNAMRSFHHREPGLAGAAFLHDKVMASIIPDGHHLSYEAIKIAKRIMGERLFAITDAVTETLEGPYRHEWAGDKYVCNGTLSGSALSMYQAFYNLATAAGIEKGEAHRMCSLYPAQVLGLTNYGRIAPRYAGQFLVTDKQLKLVDVII